jgi:WD40-like Beta Propeller Repeat
MNRVHAMGLLLTAVVFTMSASAQTLDAWPELRGDYLGQQPPGDAPEIFAPGIVSTGWGDRDLMISPDGDEIYFGMLDASGVFVRMTHRVDGVWTEPVVPSFSLDGKYGCLEQAFTPDGNRLYFLSTRPLPGEDDKPGWGNQNIFCTDRTAEGWGEPHPAPGAICSLDAEYYPSLTHDGTMYYTRQPGGDQPSIWRSRLVDGVYGEPERLPEQVNCGRAMYNAFVPRDESYLIYCMTGNEGNLGAADYWISFRDENDVWSEAVNLGEPYNGADYRAGSAYVSPDGKYFFFSANFTETERLFPDGVLTPETMRAAHNGPGNGSSDIYWVKADFLQDLRP